MANRNSAPTPTRSRLWRARRALFFVGLVVVAALSGAGLVVAQTPLPPESPLEASTFVCSAEVREGCGPENAMAKLTGDEDRVLVGLEDVPTVLVQATLAAEDRDFFDHPGIDPVGIARAVLADVRAGEAEQGGSTITQQYVKNAFLSSDRTITRKVREAVLAVKLERTLDKEEILERYLNTVYFGRGAYGVEAASRAYFGVSVRDLGLAEAAYLVGLIRAPESADASRDQQEAERRRRTVLDAMVEEGYIARTDADAADAVSLTPPYVRERRTREGLGDVVGAEHGTEHYVEHVRQLLVDRYGEDAVYGGGLRVYTALDRDLQRQAYESVSEVLDEPDDPAAAVVSVDDEGRLVTMVGGTDFGASEVNLALGAAGGGSGRQPGSAFKPFVLAEAIRQGYDVRSRIVSRSEIVLPEANAGEDWEVSNYDDDYHGTIDLARATRVSSNTAYAQLMLEVGPEEVADLARQLGVESELPVVNALALGSGEVSVLDMANAYSTFARGGLQIDPIVITKVEKVTDSGDVVVLEEATPTPTRVLSGNEAALVNWVLRQVVLEGTGRGANIGKVMAGKTGTTQDNRDAWFVGYTTELTTAVWMGYPGQPGEEPRFMDDVHGRNVTGGSFPARIWRAYMSEALDGVEVESFEKPEFGGKDLDPELTPTTRRHRTTRPPRTTEATATTAAPTTTDASSSGCEVDDFDCPATTTRRSTTTTRPTGTGRPTTTARDSPATSTTRPR